MSAKNRDRHVKISVPGLFSWSALRSLFPSVDDYRRLPKSWAKDIIAGITVGIVALPLALAFAIASGATPEMGLITAVIAGFIAAVFGGSHVQVSGPTGAMVVVLAPIAANHGVGALPLVAVMGGALVVLAGLLRLGRSVSFIPWPVIEGFTLGIAVIIFLQQVPSALGTSPGPSTNTLISTVQSFSTVTSPTVWWSLAAVLVTAAMMWAAPRIHPLVPGSIVAIIVVTALVEVLDIPVVRIGELPSALPAPVLPSVDLATFQALFGPAVAVAALTAIESLLAARVASGMSNTGSYNGDRELFGQGLAGIASGIFGGMPATGAIARTAVNVRSGAQTRLAAIIHALFLMGVVYLASGVVAKIPMVALAGVLVMTALRMPDYTAARRVIRSGRADAMIFIVTAVITVSFDLIVAVGIGVLFTMALALNNMSRITTFQVKPLPGEPQPGDDRIVMLELRGALFFGIGDRVLSVLSDTHDIDVVILRMSQLKIMDSSGARVLAELVTVLEKQGVEVFVKGLLPQHEQIARAAGVLESVADEQHVIEDLNQAVTAARAIVAEKNPGQENPSDAN